MPRAIGSFQKSLIIWILFFFPVGAFADDPAQMMGAPFSSHEDSTPPKADNSAVLDVLPGPDGTPGIRQVVKRIGLTYVRIVIDHQTVQDPINVLIRFELPHMKSCPSGDPPEHSSDVEATWQAAPGSDAFLPMNVWARNLSQGTEDVFLEAACSKS